MCIKPPGAATTNDALSKFLSGKPAQATSRRLQLWQIDGSMQCSIIGTCLTEQDLVTVLRKNKLEAAADANSYDIHSYCVRAAGQDTPISRSLNKLLDRRFEGALRIVGRTEGAAELRQIWTRLREAGQIGAAYWALLSHRHVPAELKVAMFGEVHMLSHLNGHGAQELSLRLADTEKRIADLEGRLRRSDQAKSEAMAARDAALQTLASHGRAYDTSGTGMPAQRAMPTRTDTTRMETARLAKAERALMSARARARHAEDLLARKEAEVQENRGLRARLPLRAAPMAASLPPEQPATPVTSDQRLRILYLGGRPAVLPHLRKVADVRRAELLHHDGGVDDSMHRIEELIQSCDVVMCPIDCVSHGACRLAKMTCQRFHKRFMPIATSSRSGFERALAQVSATGPDLDETPVERP